MHWPREAVKAVRANPAPSSAVEQVARAMRGTASIPALVLGFLTLGCSNELSSEGHAFDAPTEAGGSGPSARASLAARIPPQAVGVASARHRALIGLPNANAEPKETPKEPEPDAGSQAKAEQLIKDLFKADYAKRRRTDVQELATKLLQQGIETKEDPAVRYVLLREARELAVQAADAMTALRAVDEMAKWYAVDALDLKISVLEKIGRLAGTAASAKTLVDHALDSVEDAVMTDAFDAAARLLKFAEGAARKTKSLSLVTSIQGRMKELEQLRKEHEAVKPAMDALTKAPADPVASLALGKYLCFSKGDWELGLPLLAQSNDAKLKDLAERDLAEPTEPQEQADLGDVWWELASAERGPGKLQMQLRAFYWYRQSRPKLTGVGKVKVEKVMRLMPVVYLADLPEVEAQIGPWKLGRGTLGDAVQTKIKVDGSPSPNGLGMHPPGRGGASVTYRLGRGAYYFQGGVAINDTSAGAGSPITFQVFGDGRQLWTSTPMQAPRKKQDFAISIAGVDALELRVLCVDDASGAYAVWIEPILIKTPSLVRYKPKPIR